MEKKQHKEISTTFCNKFVGHMPKMRQTEHKKIKKCLKFDILVEWLCPEPFNYNKLLSP